MTVEILFILHVANGILIIIHNFERYTYMYSNTITSISTLTHIHVIIFSIHKIFIHTSIRIIIIFFVFQYMLLYFSDRLKSQIR